MGTERQGIHKDMDFKRIDEDGNIIGDYVWGEDKLVYEEIPEEKTDDDGVPIDDDGAPLPENCTVTLFEHPDFTGWEAKFQPGEYDHAALLAGGAMNDDCESIAVSEGCFAVVAENGEHDGWELVLSSNGGDGKGRYDGASLDALDNHPEGKHSVLNGVSSMVVHEGTVEEAKEMAAKVKKGRAEGLPQRGQIDLLDEGSFDQYMADRPDKLIVVDFYAPWCHWCQLLDPVWKQTAEQLPDQEFAAGVRMAKVDCEANRQLCMEHMIRAYPTIQTYTHGENLPAETYYGDRTTEAFNTWMGHEYKILKAEIAAEAQAKAAEEAGGGAAAAATGDAGAGDAGDDSKEPLPTHALRLRQKGKKGIEGCQIEGRLKVKRIPGNFHINFVHDEMDYHNSLINATHNIHYLIFSANPMNKPLSEHEIKLHNLFSNLEGNLHRLASSNTLHDTSFISGHEDRTYEHFIQIVPTYRRKTNTTVYRYTVSSAEHEDSERYPSAKFSFQISPMMVVISEKSTPLYHFMTNICALIGGLFTVFSMANGVLDSVVRKFK